VGRAARRAPLPRRFSVFPSTAEVRRTRDAAAVQARREAIRFAARGTDNLMPHIVDAVKAMATLGEISDALRAEWGVYRPA